MTLKNQLEATPKGKQNLVLGDYKGIQLVVATPCRNLCKQSQEEFRHRLLAQAKYEESRQRILRRLEARNKKL